ncbi:MAG TPA: hypothetical protein PKI15_10200, partial [Candidatus Cloacimonadota bacterium]|nr:hypothetical protein [Candidatus Cloacimonadota bacterium]
MLQNHYHGSGAFFDRFDVKYIGTGEGAQAFGWGIYVSERKGVAEDYAERVGGKNNNLVLTIGNNEYNLSDFNNWFIDDDAIPEKDFPLEASQLMIDLLHEAKDWGGNTSGTLQGDFEIIQSYHNFHTVAIAKAIEGFIDIEQLGFSLDVDWNPMQLPDHVIPIEDQDEYFEYWRYPEHYFEPIRKTKANIERALKLIDRSAYYFETIVGEYVNAESNAELGGKLIDQINYDIQSAKALHNYVQEKNVQIKLGEGNRNLYTLNVWENHTEDTLDWFGKPTEEQINKINAALLTRKGKESDLAKFEIVDGAVYAVDRKLGIRVSMTDGREIYLTLKTAVTRTAQRTSEFLLRAGIDGIKYPVNATSGGTGEKGFNYVIFDADQITITNHVRYKMLNEDLAARLKAAQERLTRTHRDPIAIAEEVAEEMGLEPAQVKEKLGIKIKAAYREGEAKVREAMAAMAIATFDEYVATNKPEETDRSDLVFHQDEAEEIAAAMGMTQEEAESLGADGYTYYLQGLNMYAYGNGLMHQLVSIREKNDENRAKGIVDLQAQQDEERLMSMAGRAAIQYRHMLNNAGRLLSHARKEKSAQLKNFTILAAVMEEDQMRLYRDIAAMQAEQKELQVSLDQMDEMISDLEKQYAELVEIISRTMSRQKITGENALQQQAEKIKEQLDTSKAKRDEMVRRMALLNQGMTDLIEKAKINEEQQAEIEKVIKPKDGKKPKKPPKITEIKLVKPTAWDISRAIFYQNILSSPATHARNIVGNETNMALEGLVNIVTGREFKSVLRTITDVKAGYRAFKDVMHDRKPSVDDKMESRAFQDANEYMTKYDTKGSMQGKLMKQCSYITRLLAAEDAFFYRRGFGAQLVSLAIYESRRTGVSVESLMAEPTLEMLTQIRYEAKRATFNYDPEGILGALVKGIETSFGILDQFGVPGKAAA